MYLWQKGVSAAHRAILACLEADEASISIYYLNFFFSFSDFPPRITIKIPMLSSS